jgi:hypothetical protein
VWWGRKNAKIAVFNNLFMASSFITKNNLHGFWIDDSIMQVVCWGLVKAIDIVPLNDHNYWLKKEQREIIYDNSQGIFIGFMNIHLDEFLINQERKNHFLEIIFETKNIFLKKGEYISIKELNDFQLIKVTSRKWLSSLETKRLVKILNFLEDVVNDKITFKVSDEINYDF